ncbi:MAG: glycosyltransferase family 4 protein [Planctomycetales bacterium]|nr:glycosyltransferase family 4 protein [Planctomycetales bacterium]
MPSQTFIRREIRALEVLGCTVTRFAHQPWPDTLVDESDKLEQQQTRYLKSGGWIALAAALLKAIILRPAAVGKAIKLSHRLTQRSDRSVGYHLAYLAQACVLRDCLVASGADHLHIHFATNSTEVGMLAHVLGGPGYSITVHGPEEFDRAACLSLDEKIARAEFVVAVSSFGCSQLMRWCGAEQWPKLKVVHCNVDDSYLEQPPKPLQQNETIVCVGRLCEQKGQLLLIEALGVLVRQGMEIRLRLVGDGPMRPECEAAILRNQLRDHVTITGWATGEEVRNEILQARALVLTSFAEGLPVVLMEALALERPVISTYIAGIPELVEPGENGWLVPAGSVDAIVTALNELMTTPLARLREMGAAGRAKVSEQHNTRTEARKLLALFQKCGAPIPPRQV